MERDGTVEIRQWSPVMFDVTFSFLELSGDVRSRCRVHDREAMIGLLNDRLHITEEAVADAMRCMDVQGWASIPHVRLSDEERLDLGFVDPNEKISN
jgi:hypothetical protein